jgi:hypothetical protein
MTRGCTGAAASALRITGANSVSVIRTFASPWPSMNASASASRRVLSVLSTAPAIGTPKCASTISGVFASITATVSFLPTPAPRERGGEPPAARVGLAQV